MRPCPLHPEPCDAPVFERAHRVGVGMHEHGPRRRTMIGFPLVQADDGERIEIVSVDGGKGAHRKLTDLGLAPGQQADIITRQPGGPVLLAVGGTRIAIGFGLALKVRVVPVPPSEART